MNHVIYLSNQLKSQLYVSRFIIVYKIHTKIKQLTVFNIETLAPPGDHN